MSNDTKDTIILMLLLLLLCAGLGMLVELIHEAFPSPK